MNQFSIVEIYTEIFIIIFLIVGYFICITFFWKYFSLKKQNKKMHELIWVGNTWLFTTTAYIPSMVAFLFLLYGINANIVLFGITVDIILLIYLICQIHLIPFASSSWYYASACIGFQKYKKKFKWGCIFFCIIYQIIAIYFEIFDISMLGHMKTRLEWEYSIYLQLTLGIIFGIMLFTGFSISIKSMRSSGKRLKYKGYFLFIAFTVYFLCGMFDTALEPIYPIFGIISKILLSVSAISFALGYFYPKSWIKDKS